MIGHPGELQPTRSLLMRWQWGLFTLVLLGSPALAQDPPPGSLAPSPVVFSADMPSSSSAVLPDTPSESSRYPLASNRNFPNFIGFMSNPLQSIDPRSLTQIWPTFGTTSVSTTPALPSADF